MFSLAQDSEGYLWVGTPDGVSRFDGLQLNTFGKDEGLGDSVVRKLLETRDGTLWAGTDRGLSRRHPGESQFEALGPDIGLVGTSVRDIQEDPSGGLWLATYAGLYRLEPTQDGFESRQWTIEDGLPHNRVRSVLLATDGKVWIGTYGGGMAVWDGQRIRTLPRNDGNRTDLTEIEVNPVVRSTLELPDGAVLVGTNRGVFRFRGDDVDLFEGAVGLADVGVTSMLLDSRGRLWFGTRDHGACRLPTFESPSETMECFRLRDGLADDAVNCLLEDREENLWIGTFGGGLSRLSTEAFHSYTLREGLPHPNVRAIGESSDGRLWLGTHGGGIAVLENGGFGSPSTQGTVLRDAKVVSAEVADGRLWFGTLSGALQERDGGFAPLRIPDLPEDSVILATHRDSTGTLWFGTIAGLWSANPTADGYEVVQYSEDAGLPDVRVNQIVGDPSGGLWIATANGVARFQGGHVTHVWSDADGLADAYVDDIHRRPDGSIWAATAGGLARIDLMSGEPVRNFTTADGLSHDKCTAIAEAEDGNLWIGTTRGINVFDGGAFLVFGTEDGMESAEVNAGAAYRSRDGRLWFGTVQGLVVFEPSIDLRRVPPPPIYLTRVEVEDVPMAAREGDRLELPHSRNDLRFEFVGLSLAFPETVQYEYRLEGLDKRWRTSRSRIAEYPSLPPGEFTFEVRARGRGGVPSPAPARISVVISTPYWQTWWFRVAVASSVLALALGLHMFRLRVLEARNLELVEQIHKRRQAEAEVRRYAEELEHTSLHDALTGLPNRALFQDRLQMAIDRARRHPEQPESRFALLWIDLDDFKLVNDSHGHRFGDRLLAFCARRLEQVIGEAGSLARLSGDEFAVLLPDATGPSYAHNLADDLQQALARPFEVEDVEVVLNASIGIVLMADGYLRAEEMLRDADTAMYRSKARGRGGSALFDPVMHRSAVATLALEQDLRRAFDRQEFELQFQPILRLRDDQLMGFEALVRWNHPDRGLMLPGEFLDRAEATGLAGPLGHWTLEEAIRQAARWPARSDGRHLAVSVNLFHRQVTQPDLPDRVAAQLRETDLPAEALHLEITEDVLIEEPEAAIAVLRHVQALDVQVYLDDFGTGYSSLSYLQKFPVDALKVDRSFVRRMDQDDDSARIVESILFLARSLGIRVIAEGVETSAQLDRLRTLDCDFVQGYLISRPLSADTAFEWAVRGFEPPTDVLERRSMSSAPAADA
ncbi:MAG: EAL domain-containing protein [Thermoanaerobaculia bacterium]|nr:EAL domain-containing protein [Thermoanaerobaculia bacterium]